MNLQTIKSLDGKDEYVLLPVAVYRALKEEIEDEITGLEGSAENDGEYVPFVLDDYVDNPVALARIKAHISQKELAERMGVSQAYISKVEAQGKVTPKLLSRVQAALQQQ